MERSPAMESARQARALLRLLRRRLGRQAQLLAQLRFDEAVAIDTAPILRALEALPAWAAKAEPVLLRACEQLRLRVAELLEREKRLLSREWVELQVDRELDRLSSQDRTGAGQNSQPNTPEKL